MVTQRQKEETEEVNERDRRTVDPDMDELQCKDGPDNDERPRPWLEFGCPVLSVKAVSTKPATMSSIFQ